MQESVSEKIPTGYKKKESRVMVRIKLTKITVNWLDYKKPYRKKIYLASRVLQNILNIPFKIIDAVPLFWREPVIEWEEGEMMDNDFSSEPTYWSEMEGYDELGRKWSATGSFCGHPSTYSELIDIDDEEMVRKFSIVSFINYA